MPRRTVPMPEESGEVLLEIWAANERMNRLVGSAVRRAGR